jgi:hypothetical protein
MQRLEKTKKNRPELLETAALDVDSRSTLNDLFGYSAKGQTKMDEVKEEVKTEQVNPQEVKART